MLMVFEDVGYRTMPSLCGGFNCRLADLPETSTAPGLCPLRQRPPSEAPGRQGRGVLVAVQEHRVLLTGTNAVCMDHDP